MTRAATKQQPAANVDALMRSRVDALENVLHQLEWDEQSASKELTKKLAKATAEVAKGGADPLYEFEWMGDAFKTAAALKVTRTLRAVIAAGVEQDKDGEAIRAQMRKIATENALRGARWPTRSTGPTHNLAAEELTSAWAEALEHYNLAEREKEEGQ